MFDNLYNKVFQTDDAEFNPRTDYYLIAFNYISDETRAQELSAGMAYHLNKNCYMEKRCTLDSISDTDLGEFIRGRSRYKMSAQADTCYTFVFDYDGTDIMSEMCDAVNIARCAINSTDKAMVILMLPDDETSSEYLKMLENSPFPQDVLLYVFVKDKYRPDEVVDNICGALLINSTRENFQKLAYCYNDLARYVASNVAAFPEAGREAIKAHPERFWTTMKCSYNDEKRVFLSYYFLNLCRNAANIKDVDLNMVFNEYYNRQVGLIDEVYWERRLYRAVEMIPRVSEFVPSDQMSLKTYFGQCYGVNGSDVVDLTLKVNLSKLPKCTNQMVNDASAYVFRVVQQYHTHDILADVLHHLSIYIKRQDDIIADKACRLRDYIKKDGEVKQDLHEYILLYIDYNREFRKQDFWAEVYDFITVNADLFAEYRERSYRLSNELNAITSKLAFSEEVALGVNGFPRFTAGRLLSADADPEIRTHIKMVYDAYIARNANKEDDLKRESGYARVFAVNPSFYKDFKYEFSVRGKYNAVISQRIGKYFMFGGN